MENSNQKKEREETIISVVVPVYNVEKYLERCVDSILSQTVKIWKSSWWMTDLPTAQALSAMPTRPGRNESRSVIRKTEA